MIETKPQPFKLVAKQLLDVADQLHNAEKSARTWLPGVAWDFSEIRKHMIEMARLIEDERPFRAAVAHQRFSVSSPARLMGYISSEKKRAAAKACARIGGRATSERKAAACRANFELARRAKKMKRLATVADGPGAVERAEIKKAKQDLRLATLRLRKLPLNDSSIGVAERNVSELEEKVKQLQNKLLTRSLRHLRGTCDAAASSQVAQPPKTFS